MSVAVNFPAITVKAVSISNGITVVHLPYGKYLFDDKVVIVEDHSGEPHKIVDTSRLFKARIADGPISAWYDKNGMSIPDDEYLRRRAYLTKSFDPGVGEGDDGHWASLDAEFDFRRFIEQWSPHRQHCTVLEPVLVETKHIRLVDEKFPWIQSTFYGDANVDNACNDLYQIDTRLLMTSTLEAAAKKHGLELQYAERWYNLRDKKPGVIYAEVSGPKHGGKTYTSEVTIVAVDNNTTFSASVAPLCGLHNDVVQHSDRAVKRIEFAVARLASAMRNLSTPSLSVIYTAFEHIEELTKKINPLARSHNDYQMLRTRLTKTLSYLRSVMLDNSDDVKALGDVD
jgi:hypothetical protein